MKSTYSALLLYVVLSLTLVSCLPPTLEPTLTPQPSSTPEPTLMPPPISTIEPTPIAMPTRNPYSIDEMDKLLNWKPSFCDEQCGGLNGKSSITKSLVPGRTNDANGALEIYYDVRKNGYVIITKDLNPQILTGTKGVSFSYKGSGAPNTIELKLLLRYPGDSEDTVFGVLWNQATDTSDNWVSVEALYDINFTCWWPANLCHNHDDKLDLTAVKRIDFAISNKPDNGDIAGTGKVAFDDLVGIQP